MCVFTWGMPVVCVFTWGRPVVMAAMSWLTDAYNENRPILFISLVQ